MTLMRNALTLPFEIGGAFSLDSDGKKRKIDELILRTGSEKSVSKLRWYEEAGYHTHPLSGRGLFPPSDTDFVTFGQEATRHYNDPARERSNPNQQVSVVFSGNGTYMLYLSGDSLPERLNGIRSQADAERKIWAPISDAVKELLKVREFILLSDTRMDDARLFDRTPSWTDELGRTMGLLSDGSVYMVMSSSLAGRGQVPVNVLTQELERAGSTDEKGEFIFRGQKIHWRRYLSQMGAIDRDDVRATLELEFGSSGQEKVTIRPDRLAPFLTIETIGLGSATANGLVKKFLDEVESPNTLRRLVNEPYRRSLWRSFTQRLLDFASRETRLGVSSRFSAPRSFYVDETFDLPVTTVRGQDSSYWIARSDMATFHPMHRLLMTVAKQFGMRLVFFPYDHDRLPYLELVPLDRRRPTAARMAIAFGRGGRGQVIMPRRQLMLEPPLAPPPLRTLFVTE